MSLHAPRPNRHLWRGEEVAVPQPGASLTLWLVRVAWRSFLRFLHRETPLPVKEVHYSLLYICIAWFLYYYKYVVSPAILYRSDPKTLEASDVGDEEEVPLVGRGTGSKRLSLEEYNTAVARVSKLLKQTREATASFWPHPLFSNGMLSTGAAEILRGTPRLGQRRELVVAADGGTFALDWITDREQEFDRDTPIIIVMPGVMGGSDEVYTTNFCASAGKRGFRCVVMVRRGCGGLFLTTPKPQNLADNTDIPLAIQTIQERFPQAPLLCAGFSFGANLLVRYMGRTGDACPLLCGFSVGNPYDLVGVSYWLRYVFRIGDWKLVQDKKEFIERNRKVLANVADPDQLLAARSYREMADQERRAWGWRSLNAYLEETSCRWDICDVRKPLLCLSALDDPVCPAEEIPYSEFVDSPYATLVTTVRGGHHAYLGLNPRGQNYSDRMCLAWFQTCLEEHRAKPEAVRDEERKQQSAVAGRDTESRPSSQSLDLDPQSYQLQRKTDEGLHQLLYSRWVLLMLLWPTAGYAIYRALGSSTHPQLQRSKHFFTGISTAVFVFSVYRAIYRRVGGVGAKSFKI